MDVESKEIDNSKSQTPEAKAHELSPKEVAAFRDMFKTLDRNSQGLIDLNEIGFALQMFSQCPTKADIEIIVKTYQEESAEDKEAPDTNVDFETFCTIMKDHTFSREELLIKVTDAFLKFDLKESGVIEAQKLKETMLTIGEVLTDAEVAEFMKDAVVSADGLVAYDNFCRKMVDSFPRPISKAASRKASGKKMK